MKTIKNILFLLAVSLIATSCLVDDDTLTDNFDEGVNLVGFSSATANSFVTAGTGSYDFTADLEVVGPTSMNINEDVTLTVSVNSEETTAIEGVHYELSNTTATLTVENGLEGTIPYTILTDDSSIVAPSTFYLVLDVAESSGGNGVAMDAKMAGD